MQEWNVAISVNVRGFQEAFKKLGAFGKVRKTDFYNVLVMKVDDIHGMLEALRKSSLDDPGSLSFLSRLIPVTASFSFQSREEFENKAQEAVLTWAPELGGKGFHVRMRRRGFKEKLCSHKEEQFLDTVLLESLEHAGTPGHITFDDPDAIIAVETIANHAGLSLWTREDQQRYPFIKVD